MSNRKRGLTQSPTTSKRLKPAKPSTKITDLNDDCLEHIFKQLKLTDLLNTVDAQKSFKQAANVAFVRNLKNNQFIIEINLKLPRLRSNPAPNQIEFDKLPESLQLLRNFGEFITSLRVGDSVGVNAMGVERLGANRYNRIIPYIVQYCSDNLKQIHLQYANEWLSKLLVKPFPTVTSLIITSCKLDADAANFNKWFPEMDNLHLNYIKFVSTESMIVTFPNLLKIELTKPMFSLGKFLQMNPQLCALKFEENIHGFDTLNRVSKHLGCIRQLAISLEDNDFMVNNQPIHFKNVRRFQVEEYLGGLIPTLKFSFDRLDEFVAPSGGIACDNDFLDFLRRHQTVSKLYLNLKKKRQWGLRWSVEKSEVANVLTNLKVAQFGCQFTVGEVIDFLKNCSNIEVFGFVLTNRKDLDVLMDQLNKHWTFLISNANFVQMNKRL